MKHITLALVSKTVITDLFKLLFLFQLAFMIFLSACSQERTPSEFSGDNAEEAVFEGDKAVRLEMIDADGYEKMIRERRGLILVINFWAADYPACVESFPKLVKLNSEYMRQPVEVVAVNLNFSGSGNEIKDFLIEHEAGFANFKVDVKNIEDFIASVNPDWDGDIPAVFVYNAFGDMIGEYYGAKAVERAQNKVDSILP